ncbi:hypothetical protein B4U79_12014 [Dinothrombium tinctorium]|uniref:Palmitoyltransferase n=1 Tax=Dinothrombium tinctorium TaxID=1965070 RepID=A0A443QI06_9ACAR|nr:hypothetical protein B4U79_12014 [Dinothrombium tinctorium]
MFGYNDETKGSETVLHLLSRGANLNHEDKNGMNALHYATLKNNDETVHLLLTVGIDANDASYKGVKPLHLAISNSNTYLIKILTPLTKDAKNMPIRHLKPYKSFRETLDDTFTLIAKMFIFICYLGALFWVYPQYAFHYYPATKNYLLLHSLLITSSVLLWFFWYQTMNTDPGYLPLNTTQYSEKLQTKLNLALSIKSTRWLPVDPNQGIKFCHTCKTIQPRRSKHCRFCNRCTARFDHHCIYLDTCIGERNRLFFFGLIMSMLLTGLLFLILIFIVIRQENWNFNSYHLSNISYCVKLIFVGGILTITTLRRAAINLTQNEEIRFSRYKYLRSKNGSFRNPFDRGIIKNLFEHFNLSDYTFKERFPL